MKRVAATTLRPESPGTVASGHSATFLEAPHHFRFPMQMGLLGDPPDTNAPDERRLVDGRRRRCTPDGSGPWKLDVLECKDFGELVEVGVAVK
jgi:hypothetical protein